MDVIVFDLETTRNMNRSSMQYIIEIGAVKLVNRGGKLSYHSRFQAYVLPPNKYVSKADREFIHASKMDFKHAKKLRDTMRQFIHWIGNKPYYLCAWSTSDLHILVRNYVYGQKYNLSWIENYNDLQQKFGEMININRQISLTDSLKMSGIKLEGNQHSAIDDAMNTAKILLTYQSHIPLDMNSQSSLFSQFVVFLYSKCSSCNEVKYYTEFPIKKRGKSNRGKCNECLVKKRRYKKLMKLVKTLRHVMYSKRCNEH
ncbi:3'-5' exonuclease [Evansella cellulosilytica]|uniref:Exonuclease RNase T and DNA polymerase III n=1 Tax=Evansella cellulosilytica (strain ATCC 21833 / DSM 2522 / FERM P-1141 / JCM 9156 / N-4) TaxID=649639 RepID=E6U1M9_EVAC2|nr:3'-5' exonuclease [Evansella cellulosilytica]ADU30392.1 Exonuclease RNase T and DNA polymerase III [Evansella cellulosilytica DSM 2522]